MLATYVGQTRSYPCIFSVLEGVLCLWMGWPSALRNDTCFSDGKVCSCQSNVDCVSLAGCLLSSERQGADWWLAKLISDTDRVFFVLTKYS